MARCDVLNYREYEKRYSNNCWIDRVRGVLADIYLPETTFTQSEEYQYRGGDVLRHDEWTLEDF